MDIKGTNVSSPIVPFTTDDKYPTHDEKYGKGGYKSVATITEMNSIPVERRTEGMLVRISADNSYYVLKNGTFVKEEFGGGGGSTKPVEYDSTITSDSTNAPQTKAVYNELIKKANITDLDEKAGIYVTKLTFAAIEYDCVVDHIEDVTDEQLEEILNIEQAYIDKKVVIVNDDGSMLDHYRGVVNFSETNPHDVYTLVINNSKGIPVCFTATRNGANQYKWSINYIKGDSGGDTDGNSNIKVLTSSGLFDINRSENVILNKNDENIIKSLFSNGYKNTRLYYAGEIEGYYSICPVTVNGNDLHYNFDETDQVYIELSAISRGVVFREYIVFNSDVTKEFITNSVEPNIAIRQYVTARYHGVNNGYIKYNDGTLIQYGRDTSKKASERTLYFPQSFEGTSYSIVVSPNVNSTVAENILMSPMIINKQSSHFVFGMRYTNNLDQFYYGSQDIEYIAIGKWK